MMMFLRRDGDTASIYTENASFKSLMRGAIERINQCAVDAVIQVSTEFAPEKPTNDNPTQLDGIRSAGSFLWRKIQGNGGTTEGKGTFQPSDEGLGFLVKRIHEMLLGLALTFESNTILQKEKEYGMQPGISNADVK